MDIEGLIINSVIAVLFGTLEAFKATPGVPELQERVKSGDPAAIKEATDFINTHVDEIEAAAKEQYKAILDIEAKTPNTELNIDSNTIDSAVTPQDGAQAMQQVGGIQTPAQTQNAPTQNAPKASVDGTILRAREMWSQGNPASTIFNETGKIIGKDGSVYSESGELQMKANRDIMSPEGGVAGDANKGTNSSGNNGTYEWSTGRTGVNAGGNNGIGGGLDKGTGKPWSALDTGTTQQLTKVFRNHVIAEAGSELSILKNAYVKRYGSEAAAVTEMAKRFYEDLSMSPVIAENRWANFIPKLSELVDSFNKLSAQRSSNNTQIMPGGMGERSGSTYESLSDPRALKLLEQYNRNIPKTEAEKRAELARMYEELFAKQQAGKTAVEKDTGQGYNGSWNGLYDENVQGTEGSNGRTAEGAGDLIDGIKITDSKVGGKIPVDEFKTIRQSSIKNPDADSITLGKYTNGLDSYIAKAGGNSSYFDMGSEWNTVRKKYNLEYDEMFEYFNKPALKDAIESGKSIQFSHNPINDDGFLGMEWDYIKDTLHLTDGDLLERGGMWYVK